MSQFISSGLRLRTLMNKKCLCLPGCYSGIIGRLAAEAGFEGCYISGGALSASSGIPDIGILPLSSFTQIIKDIYTVCNLPILADADTGFGGTEMISKTVHEYIQAGAGALHIEDQKINKKCGHLDNKTLISIEEMCEKIKVAVHTSNNLTNGDFIICARTDSRNSEGFKGAVERAKEYVNAGAHMIFPEGLEDLNEFKLFGSEMQKLKGNAPQGGPYILANMTEFGKTKYINYNDFRRIGYNAVIFPVSTLRIALKSVKSMLTHLKEKGSVEELVGNMYTRDELYKTLHYTPEKEWSYPSPCSSFCSFK